MEHLRPSVRPPWLPRRGGAAVWAHLPPEPAAPVVVPHSLDLSAVLPARRTTWRYRGSLTTPPCTEGVAWVILTEPLTLGSRHVHQDRS